MEIKKEYEAPTITEVGSFEDITKGGADGDFTDMNFSSDTPRGDLTFS